MRMRPNLEHVAEAARGEQAGPRALAFEDRVGGDGGAVDHFAHLRGRELQGPEQTAQTVDDKSFRDRQALVASLRVATEPSAASNTRSVNVPPMSTPIR